MYRAAPAKPIALAVSLFLAACTAAERTSPGPDFLAERGPWVSEVGREHPLTGRIWVPSRGEFVGPAALLNDLAGPDYVILGEKHDNEDHHRIQAWALEQILQRGRRMAVGFEMFRANQADALADYLAAHPRDAAGLGPAVNWAQQGWPDWSQYQPIAQAALDNGAPILAADLSRPTLRAITKEGTRALGQETERRLGLTRPMPASLDESMRREIIDAHCNQLPASMIGPMTTVMRARDAYMAGTLMEGAALPGRDGAVLIAGTGHAQRDHGVPFHLAILAPGARSVSLAMVEVAEGEPDPAAYAARFNAETLPFDYVWFTPHPEREPACERFADQLRRAKARHRQEHAPN